MTNFKSIAVNNIYSKTNNIQKTARVDLKIIKYMTNFQIKIFGIVGYYTFPTIASQIYRDETNKQHTIIVTKQKQLPVITPNNPLAFHWCS